MTHQKHAKSNVKIECKEETHLSLQMFTRTQKQEEMFCHTRHRLLAFLNNKLALHYHCSVTTLPLPQ